MRLRTRLVLFGAVLPAVALGLAIVIAGWWLRRAELEDIDHHLLNQAAIESVGLFDGPSGRPHVHVPASTLAAVVAEFTADAAIYDAAGVLVSAVADPARVPRTVRATDAIGAAVLATEHAPRRRTLTMRVTAPDGRVYTLWLGQRLARVDDAMRRYYRATGTALGGLLAALIVIQLVAARRITRRVDTMIRFVPRLRDGETGLPPDPVGDELGMLREVLRASAARLASARAEQDRLLADAAHELRTPLTVIRTESDLALRRERSADELRASLRAVRDEADRLTRLAGALLDLQAVRHLGFDHHDGDLCALVEEACRAIEPLAASRKLQVRRALPPAAPARFDERALRQALDNLLANAVRHATPGTPIEVGVERHDGAWRIAVADHGPGIPPDQAEQVFEPFRRLGASSGGGGLGLTIVREVMDRHRGRAGVDLSYRAGARVYLDLPDPPAARAS